MCIEFWILPQLSFESFSAALFPVNGGCSALAATEPVPNTVTEPLLLPVKRSTLKLLLPWINSQKMSADLHYACPITNCKPGRAFCTVRHTAAAPDMLICYRGLAGSLGGVLGLYRVNSFWKSACCEPWDHNSFLTPIQRNDFSFPVTSCLFLPHLFQLPKLYSCK